MVMISPQIATMKPAPADSRTSRTGTVWPVGAPRRFGSVVKRILRLGHADRQVAVARGFPGLQLVADALVGDHLIGAVDALGDGLDLLEQRHVVGIERREVAAADLGQLDHLVARSSMPFAPNLGPVLAQDRLGALLAT
jgi:hypothetical protein